MASKSFDSYINLAIANLSSTCPTPTPVQKAAITSFLSKRDTFVYLPTGYGKSLIYQLSLLTAFELSKGQQFPKEAVIVVVSSLNSLISHQIRSCERFGLSACKIEEGFKDSDVLFLSPEKLEELSTKRYIRNLGDKLLGIVVDESHCVVTWGTNKNDDMPSREAYGKIGCIRGFTKAPILCLTATAGSKMRNKIIKSLMMRKPQIIQLSPKKTNIKLMVSKCHKDELEETFSWLIQELNEVKQETKKTIVYCCSLTACGEIYAILDENVIETANGKPFFAMYHSKTPRATQERVFNLFVKPDSAIRVVIATSALGMGVDIPDIDRVIHYGIPSDVEDYVQEIGRCGRDSRKCLAILYYKPYHLAHCEPAIRNYVKNTNECRKDIISKYFKDKKPQTCLSHECCDTCQENCNCNQNFCKEKSLPKQCATTPKNGMLSRSVNHDDRELLQEVLNDMEKKNATIPHSIFGTSSMADAIDSKLIEQIMNKCHLIFSVKYLMDNFPILSKKTAKDIIALFNDIFNDIEESELLASMEVETHIF